jgi:hypothetical protein
MANISDSDDGEYIIEEEDNGEDGGDEEHMLCQGIV